MAIGSVKELIDYEIETIKIAKKYGGGGGSVNLSLIADNYNPNRTTSYPTNDMVVYDGKLYKSRSKVPPAIGEFDSDMWDLAANEYDSTHTYNEYDLVTHEGFIYRCDEANTTGEWDSSKWTDISEEYGDYNSNARYPNLTYTIKVKYDGNYYHNNENLDYTGTMGDFGSAYWSETTVEAAINNIKVPYATYICQTSEIATDSNGFMTNSVNIPPTTGRPTAILSVFIAGSMPALNQSYLIEVVQGLSGGNNVTKFRILNLDGTPKANVSAGDLADMGVVYIVCL